MADIIEIYARGNWPSVPPTTQVGHGSRAGDPIKIWSLDNIVWFKDATVLSDTITALGGTPDHPFFLLSPAKLRLLLGISNTSPFLPSGAVDPNVTVWIDSPIYQRTHFFDPPISGQWQVKQLPFTSWTMPFGFNPNDVPFYDETVDWFITNGWSVPGSSFPNPPYRFQWSFQFMQYGGAYRNPPTAPPAPAPIQQRRWIDGFEAPNDGAGGSGGMNFSRDASRHIDGMGLAVRNDSNVQLLKSPGDFGAPTTKSGWIRGYVRLRRAPDTDGMGNSFIRWAGASSPANTNALRVNTLGQLELTTTAAVLATSPAIAVFPNWDRLDIFFNYSSGAGGTFQLYINRQLVIDLSGILSNGFGQNQNYLNVGLGAPDPSGARGLQLDMDDFMEAPIPPALTGMDWLMGSRIMLIRATSVDPASHASWTSTFRGPLGNPVLSTNALQTTATPSVLLRYQTDWNDQQLADSSNMGNTQLRGAAPAFQNGCVAAVLGWFCQGAGGTSQFRIRDGAGNIVGSNGILVGGQAFYNAMYRPTGMIEPTILGAVTMEWETGAGAGTNQVYMAHMQAEDLGIFGPEDFDPTVSPPPPDPPTYAGIHNYPYPRSPWALIGGMPSASVFIAYGVYTGNGTGADLNLPYPPCWLYIRPVSPAGANGVRWWSSMFTAHLGMQPGLNSASMPQALQDPAFSDQAGNSLMRRAGAGTQENQNLATYQYVAFCDPGQRFTSNGAFATPSTIASAIQALRLANFTPQAAFFCVEQIGTLTTADFYYKGIGHAGAFASKPGAAEVNNIMTFGTGQITTETAINQSGSGSRPQTSYSLWRTQDGVSSGPSQGVPVAITSYIGDGTASRVIPLDLGGRFPVYAQVTPHNALSWVRDPSHTGTTSAQMGALTSTSTTAITAGGINQITVGITLNALGIVYDVFVLPGCSQTGWDNNGGDFCPLNWGGYENTPPEPYIDPTPVNGTPDLCANDWETPRADGLPYVPLMPGSTQDEHQ